ncbi:RNase H domain-containing protein [Trichonephila clavipes]|nr:RNase H domain-containing protein [Trichonephila clavipes]
MVLKVAANDRRKTSSFTINFIALDLTILSIEWHQKQQRHTGILGNERAVWLAKEATKLSDLIPMSIPKSYHKKVFKEKIISEWNNLYEISNNAHLTKEFIPSIQSRLKAKHFHPNFELIQFLTGHGNFKAYLKRFNLSPTDQCSCSSDTIQNVKHLILACTKFSSES